jgi:hypothetical protein
MGGSSKNPFHGVEPYVPPTTPSVQAAAGWLVPRPRHRRRELQRRRGLRSGHRGLHWPAAQKGLDRWQTPGPHYLTRPTTGLVGRAIRAEYAVIGDCQFFGSVGGQSETVYVCLFFRAPGDNWQNIDGFRWWSEAQFLLVPGVSTVEVPLDHASWVSVVTPGITEQFLAAKASAIEVGLTFGNDEGRGHGVSSPTGGSTFVLRSFTVVE